MLAVEGCVYHVINCIQYTPSFTDRHWFVALVLVQANNSFQVVLSRCNVNIASHMKWKGPVYSQTNLLELTLRPWMEILQSLHYFFLVICNWTTLGMVILLNKFYCICNKLYSDPLAYQSKQFLQHHIQRS